MIKILQSGLRAAKRILNTRFSEPWEPHFTQTAGAALTRMLRIDSEELVPLHAVRTVRPLAKTTIR